jgi:hypothetical protein
MIQTLKKKIDSTKKKIFEKKIQKFKDFSKSNLDKNFVTKMKQSRAKHCFLNKKKKKAYLFLKLIQKANNQFKVKFDIKQKHLELLPKTLLNKMLSLFKIKFNVETERLKNVLVKSIKNLSKDLYSRRKYLYVLRQKRKSKLSSSFYEP